MGRALDIGALQTSPGAAIGAYRPSPTFALSLTFGGTSHFALDPGLHLSLTLGGVGGYAIAGVGTFAFSLTFGGLAHFATANVKIFSVSITLGAESHFAIARTYPLSISLGGEAHFATSDTMHAYPLLTFGGLAHFSAFASTSVPATQIIVIPPPPPGSGTYTSQPAAVVSGGAGAGAVATVTLGAPGTPLVGQITSVTVTQSGDGGYTYPVTVTVSGGGGPTQTLTAYPQTQQSLVAGSQAVNPISVRLESYGVLTIECAIESTAPPTILPPPIRQPNSQQVPPGQQTATGDSQQVQSRPWNTWYQSVYAALQAQQQLQFLCPSVDETDSEWYATAASADGKTDPLTLELTFVGQSRFGIQVDVIAGGSGYTSATVLTLSGSGGSGYGAALTPIILNGAIVGATVTKNGYGYLAPLSLVATDTGGGSGSLLGAEVGRQFAVGDYVLWNDPKITAGICSYEIDQITAIVPIDATHATITLKRNAGGPADQAQYNSPFVGHTQTTAIYRLINKLFVPPPNTGAGPQIYKFPWDNMTVAAVSCTVLGSGSAPTVVNLGPFPYNAGTTVLNPEVNPPTPGLRTMNGAAYTSLGILGSIGMGQTSLARVSVQAHESIRTVYAKVLAAPTGPTAFNGDGNACIVIYVCYISPGGVVGLIDTLVIDQNVFNSYSSSNVPDGRQMPFHSLWPTMAPNYDWPPNRLPVCTSALTAGGLLQLPITPTAASTVLFAPDGAIDFIVAQVGTSTPGSNLTVTVQT